MAISVIFIRVNLRVDPRVCYRCHTDCMRFNASSKILFLIAEGLPSAANDSHTLSGFPSQKSVRVVDSEKGWWCSFLHIFVHKKEA
jgi:hypothetical protein